MSFMVENLFTSPIRNNVQKFMVSSGRNFSQKCSVRAGEDLPCGAKTQAFTLQDLAALKFVEGEVMLDSRGYLVTTDYYKRQDGFLPKLISPSFSPDIHSCNIQIDITPSDGFKMESASLVMRVTRHIPKGTELFLWFSEEVLALLNMPFLTPKNIAGHRKYSCHLCSKTFESPNPLKIHLLLSCERESKAQVWINISRTLNQTYLSTENKLRHKMEDFEITRPSSVQVTPNFPKIDPNIRCLSEPPLSAFLPYKKQSVPEKSGSEILQPLNLTTSSIPIHTSLGNGTLHNPSSMNNILELRLTKSLEELSSNYAADVELFASNWGKMKQGHLCVYCGKVYSRKYGLKIHIRTHTGYKPLKCKYCQRPFGDPSNLNKHVRLHASGVTPYMCSLCGKVLVRRRDLERHMKSQHNSEDACSSDDNVDIDSQ